MFSKIWEYIKKPFSIIAAALAAMGVSYLFGRCSGKKEEKNKNLISSFEKEKIAQDDLDRKRLEVDTLRIKDSEKLHEILSEPDSDIRDRKLCDWAREEV